MKNFLLIGVMFFGAGCIETSHLYVTKNSSPIKVEEDSYVFENDTIRILYDFWDRQGKMNFSISNKLNVPIYIDWKKSSFIRNDIKEDYWKDIETTNSVTTYTGATISGNYVYLPSGRRYNIASTLGQAYATAIKTKPERITFIAPHSVYNKNQFSFLSAPIALGEIQDIKTKTEKRIDDTTKKYTVYYRKFDMKSSPLLFRNFLTFSTSEKFDNEYYVDNGFFLSGIYEMDKRHFIGKAIDATHYEYPWADSRYFFIETVPKSISHVR